MASIAGSSNAAPTVVTRSSATPNPVSGTTANLSVLGGAYRYVARVVTSPRVGIPAYVLIAQMLYQDTLEAAVAEARQAGRLVRLCSGGWRGTVGSGGFGEWAAVHAKAEKTRAFIPTS
jgi:hypothetical protein